MPIGELALLDVELPSGPVRASQVGAHRGLPENALAPEPAAHPAQRAAHLSVLELLLDIPHDTLALQADEGPEDELRTNLAGASDGSRDARELSDLVGPEVADSFDEGEVVEGELEGADGEAGGGGGARVGVGVEVGGGVLLDEVLEGASEVGKETAEGEERQGKEDKGEEGTYR